MLKNVLLAVAGLFSCSVTAAIKETVPVRQQPITFTENNGQVSDQDNKPRPDVLFSGNAGDMAYHLRNNGISYQFYRVSSWEEKTRPGTTESRRIPTQGTICRLDINWLDCAPQAGVETDHALPGYTNYYYEACPNGVHNVKTYTGITYRSIYKDIDLHYYGKDGSLKYDFLVAPYADYSKIRLSVAGATGILLARNGSLIIHTGLGDIEEGAPLVLQDGKKIPARWVVSGQVLSFAIGSYDRSRALTIDPLVRSWATWYGGANEEISNASASDNAGNVYLCGDTRSSTGIATTGSHQVSYTFNDDTFLAKFDNSGTRLWATYYGGNGSDWCYGCVVDLNNNVFIVGATGTNSQTGVIATPGAHQTTIGGNSPNGNADAFIVKFNSAGVRQWGTYYGSNSSDFGEDACTDSQGNVYMYGYTETAGSSASVIATPGAHQTTNAGGYYGDAFLVKFNSSGVRQWGTFYGSYGSEFCRHCTTDPSDNVIITGFTDGGGSGLSTSGSHQSAYGGGSFDCYLAKFNASGVRQWGTFYGGSGDDRAYDCATDGSGNIFISGYSTTSVSAVMTTPSAYQPSTALSGSGLLVKFSAGGLRQWGTFYDYTSPNACATNTAGEVYIAGTCGSGLQVSPGCHQPVFGGGMYDGFAARFSGSGSYMESTFYGGTGEEQVYGCATNTLGNVYVSGFSNNAGNAMVTAGSLQPFYGGGTYDAFIAQFFACETAPAAPVNATAPASQVLCAGNGASLAVTPVATVAVNWYAAPAGSPTLYNGNAFNTTSLAAGSYSFYAEAFTCTNSATRTEITVTVNPLPVLSITATSPTLCAGSSTSLTLSGAATFTWGQGGNSNPLVLTPTAAAVYSATGTNTYGCMATTSIAIAVNALPVVSAASSQNTICAGESATLLVSGALIYTWSQGSIDAALAVTPASTTGYTVTGTDANGCTGTTAITQYVDVCLGIHNTGLATQLIVYPNPGSGEFVVEAGAPTAIVITNALGQLIMQQHLIQGRQTISLAGEAGGIYFMQIMQGGKVIKLVKQ